MLNFFKKSGQKKQQQQQHKRSNSTPTIGSEFIVNDNKYDTTTKRNSLSFYSHGRINGGPLAGLDDEGLYDISELEALKERSCLSKTLKQVLKDKSALGYFIQFLETRSGLAYIRCWLDIENFQIAIRQYDDSRRVEMHSPTKPDHDSLSVSTDCDSYTADSTSLCDFTNHISSEKPCEIKLKLDIGNCDRDSETSPKCNENDTRNKYIQEFIDDALKIFKKYIALEAPENINCTEDIRKDIIENICNTENTLPVTCFKKVQSFVFEILDKEYFEAFLASDYFCKHQIDVLTSGNVVLDDILYNETALFYFMEFLEQESNRTMLEFWLAASNFHQQLHSQKEFFDPDEAQNDAVILYDKYFSLQALCPLGFGDKIRFAVEQNICGENGLMQDCFQLPMKMVEHILERHYLKSFLASQLYYKYLSELINTVQSSGYCLYDKNRCLSSDCGSEKSISTNSTTFLAMENPNCKKREKGDGTDMNIDTSELYDPDSLWKRKKYHRLSFGRVTELGKFVTDFEPQPDKKNESRIRSVVKKFVNLEEDKNKEDLAWQVAEMIVKDITSITLSEPKT